MVIPLPSALADFSKTATQNIAALDAIQRAIPNIQNTIQQNVNTFVTDVITSELGSLFSSVPEFIESAASRFLDAISNPSEFFPNLQLDSFEEIFGSGLPGGTAIDEFLSRNVRLEDIIPAQQLFNIVKNLGSASMFVDPLQAYTQVTKAAGNVSNFCKETSSIITDTLSDITNLLSTQTLIDYSQIPAMTKEHFSGVKGKIEGAMALYDIVTETFSTRGRYDAAQVSAFCAAIDDITNTLMFSASKILEFDVLRKRISDRITRIREIGRDLPKVVEDVKNYIGSYATSALFGKLFQAVQRKVLDVTKVDLARILRDAEALSALTADDRAKLMASWGIVSSLQAIKAYICKLDPSNAVVDPGGEFAPLKTAYDTMVGILNANDIAPFFESLENEVGTFVSSMSAGVIRDNTAALTAISGTVSGILSGLAPLLTNVCGATDAFKAAFSAVTSIDPERIVGAFDLFDDVGLGTLADIVQAENFGDFTTMSLSESTKPGQLAESIRQRISELPDGNEKERLTLVYSEVYSRHRATVLSMDFQRREDLATFLTLDEEETNRQLVNKVTKTFSGLDPNAFDEVLT